MVVPIDSSRIAIAVRADTAEFGFGPTRLNRNLWRSYDDGLILPKSIYDATLDLWKNPQQHSFYCTRATAFCVHAGIADAMGKEWTDKNGNRFFFLPEGDPAAMRRGLLEHTVQDTSTEWITGDWGYIQNEERAIGFESDIYAGENLIYLGGGKYWGHFANDPFANNTLTLPEWEARVNEWGKSNTDKRRWCPKVGLSKEKK